MYIVLPFFAGAYQILVYDAYYERTPTALLSDFSTRKLAIAQIKDLSWASCTRRREKETEGDRAPLRPQREGNPSTERSYEDTRLLSRHVCLLFVLRN